VERQVLLKEVLVGTDQATVTIPGRLRRSLLRVARDERGMTLPTALFALIAAFGLATAAIFSSIDAQQGTALDSARKNSIAAADAGASVALMRLNRFQDDLSEATPCIGPLGEPMPETSTGSGWCPPVPAETVGGTTFSYQVSAFTPAQQVSVISVGTSGTFSRRVEVGLVSYDGQKVFADEHLIGEDGIDLEGTVDVRTDVGTNGDITGKGNAYTLCGNARHGVGKSAPEPDCGGEVFEGTKELPAIEAPGDYSSNCRLELTCPHAQNEPEEKYVDTYTKRRTSTNPWDSATRTINVGQNATLSMGGSDYLVCGLFINNGELIMLDNAKVRIFIRPPEECGLDPGDPQVVVTGNANIVSTGYNPEAGQFDVPGIYLLGPGGVVLNGNSGTNELMLYAPFSEIEIGGNATWIGMIAGKSIRLHGNPTMESDPGVEPPEITVSGVWQRTRYVECTGPTATPPDANC
jgi:hypothetical protein